MNWQNALALAIIALVAMVLVHLSLSARRRLANPEARHRELRGAHIVYAEKRFETAEPFALRVRVDRAYERNGLLYLVELKTRRAHRVHFSDIIELSAQRVALTRATGRKVSDVGFVTTQVDRTRHCHRVALLDEQAIVALAKRRAAITAGSATPLCAKRDALCRHCAYKTECKGTAASHETGSTVNLTAISKSNFHKFPEV